MAGTQLEPASAQETSWDRVWASQTSKLLTIVPPYLIGIIVFGLAAAFHALWGGGVGVAWAVLGETLCTVILTGVTWGVSHHRGDWGRLHTTATTFLTGMWVTCATVAGVTQPVILYLWIVGGLAIATSWNIRTVIRVKGGVSGVVDPLAFLFDLSKGKAKLGAAALKTIEAGDRKVEAEMALPAGEKTVEDVQKRVEYIESAMGMPPGTMTISPDLDNAAKAKVVISDPRVMRNPIPWPGPSRPGGSIAAPIRPGMWQDLDDVEYRITGHHVQVMGMTGSGKSIGCLWNALAEIVSRTDVMVLAIDIVKDRQTLGPLEEGLHRLEITPEGARSLVRDLQAKLAERTAYLAENGLVKWKQGCGLTYIVLWIEEAWKLFEVLTSDEMDQFEELMKALRSAGGTVVYSLQRGDHTQAPTMIKGQAAYWCFGLASSHDARWGLSEAQQSAGAAPELWMSDQPGMAYLHAPGMDRARIAMPMRTFDWAEDTDAIRAHCALYPAAGRPVDAISAPLVRLSGGQVPATVQAQPSQEMPVAEEELDLLVLAAELVINTQLASVPMLTRKLRVGHEQAGRLMRELQRHEFVGPDLGDEGNARVLVEPGHLDEVVTALRAGHGDGARTPDPDPSIEATLDDPIEDDPDDAEFTFGQPGMAGKLPPEEARLVMAEQLDAWRASGRARFATRDMVPVRDRTGMSRAWVQKQLRVLLESGELGYDDEAQEFVIREMQGARS